jgi:hypothetical protein
VGELKKVYARQLQKEFNAGFEDELGPEGTGIITCHHKPISLDIVKLEPLSCEIGLSVLDFSLTSVGA